MKTIRESTDQEIKSYYYLLISESRNTFAHYQRLQSFLESPLLMCVYIVLWGLVGFSVMTFWLFPDPDFSLLLVSGIPLCILLMVTKHSRKEMNKSEQLVDRYHIQLDSFRSKLEQANRTIPDYPYFDTDEHYLPFDHSGHLTDDHIRDTD
ncbi:hypothetical protein KS419_05785 [Bacillus tamaricis]|uniref:Uncharacterized protein n=2 Tax=Evansella tamaricis TaxID=2069301 RepID=A0ABS6JC49_9BACI|nr:hypothetical protein [Evansella tamaricis]MBU9711235.1 hypothetical protein [Evansella tamaricis]